MKGRAAPRRRDAGRDRPAAVSRRPAARRRSASRERADRILTARDLMTRTPITVPEQMTVSELCDLLQEKNINGAPVVDREGRLVGVVTQEDIIYGAMGHPMAGPARGAPPGGDGRSRRGGKRVVAMLREQRLQAAPAPAPRPGERPFWSDEHRASDSMGMPVSAIMTSPAISADEETPVSDLCRIMWNLRIHRVPILNRGRVTGLVSSMDLCRAILDGKIRT